jgi:transposase
MTVDGGYMCRKRLILNIHPEQKSELERIIADKNSSDRLVTRCRIILLTDREIPMKEIAEILHVSKATVNTWRQAYIAHGIEGLKAKKRPGRPSRIAREILSNLFPELSGNLTLPLKKALKMKMKSPHAQAKINALCGMLTCGSFMLPLS